VKLAINELLLCVDCVKVGAKGEEGRLQGAVAIEVELGALVPTAFVAVILNEYKSPLIKFDITIGLVCVDNKFILIGCVPDGYETEVNNNDVIELEPTFGKLKLINNEFGCDCTDNITGGDGGEYKYIVFDEYEVVPAVGLYAMTVNETLLPLGKLRN
jgi:hypothetical protein